MTDTRYAMRVGLSVIAAALVIFYGLYFFNQQTVSKRTYTLHVLFDDVTGVLRDSPVTMAGVQIGKVSRVDLVDGGRRADVGLLIDADHRIPVGSIFQVSTPVLGGNGTGSIAVTAPIRRTAETYRPGERNIVGQPAGNLSTTLAKAGPLLDQLTETARRSDALIDEFTKTARNVNELSGSRALRGTLSNVNQASANGVKLTQQLSSALATDNARVASMLGRLDSAAAQAQGIAQGNRGKIDLMIGDLRSTTESLSGITSSLNETLHEGGAAQNLVATVANLKTATDKLNKIADNFQALSSDQGMQGDLKATVHNIRQSTEESTYLIERLNRLVGARRPAAVVAVPGAGAVIVGPGTGGRKTPADVPLLSRVELLQDLRDSHFRMDVDAIAPLGQGRFTRAGVYGVADRSRAILQMGQNYGGYDLRGGLYNSQLSLGGDLGLGRPVTLSFDLYDPNKVHLDARGVIRLGDALGLVVGADDITRRTSPVIGLEYRH